MENFVLQISPCISLILCISPWGKPIPFLLCFLISGALISFLTAAALFNSIFPSSSPSLSLPVFPLPLLQPDSTGSSRRWPGAWSRAELWRPGRRGGRAAAAGGPAQGAVGPGGRGSGGGRPRQLRAPAQAAPRGARAARLRGGSASVGAAGAGGPERCVCRRAQARLSSGGPQAQGRRSRTA
jgi:hypothetical protein